MAGSEFCFTSFPTQGYAYTVETAVHEWLLRSPHRTTDGALADYFYVPLYTACAILPVYDYVGPGPFGNGYPMRPVTAMRMVTDAVEMIRRALPYWDAKQGKDHLFLLAHDEGGCWAPKVCRTSQRVPSLAASTAQLGALPGGHGPTMRMQRHCRAAAHDTFRPTRHVASPGSSFRGVATLSCSLRVLQEVAENAASHPLHRLHGYYVHTWHTLHTYRRSPRMPSC